MAACAALTLVAACGTESDDDDGGDDSAASFTPPDLPMLEELGDPEGELNILAWAGYAEDGSTDPAYDWVTPFEEYRLPGQLEVLRHVGRGGQPDEDRGVRRRVGLWGRLAADDRRR